MNLFPFSTMNYLRATQHSSPVYSSPTARVQRDLSGQAAPMPAEQAQVLAASGLHGARALAQGFGDFVKSKGATIDPVARPIQVSSHKAVGEPVSSGKAGNAEDPGNAGDKAALVRFLTDQQARNGANAGNAGYAGKPGNSGARLIGPPEHLPPHKGGGNRASGRPFWQNLFSK